jgi:hypothetical protein
MTYIQLHLPSIFLPTPWLQVLLLAPGDPLQHLIPPVKIQLISLAHINITPAPSDDAAETQIIKPFPQQLILSQKIQSALDYYLCHQKFRMPHQSVLAAEHLDPDLSSGFKNKLQEQARTLLPSFSISSTERTPSTELMNPVREGTHRARARTMHDGWMDGWMDRQKTISRWYSCPITLTTGGD